MSTRGKEIDVILLDVGPHMHPFLDNVSKALFNYALAKSLNKPSHEMAILLYGTTGTNNALNEEFAADGKDEYENISVLQELRTPNQHTLQQLQQLQPGTGTSDFVDAITVVMDLIIKAAQARVVQTIPKKLILISNFAQATKEIEEGFQQQLVEGMKAHHMQLQIICLKAEGADELRAQTANLEVLGAMKAEAGDKEIKQIKQAAQLLGVFRTREVTYQCVKAELEIGTTMKLRNRLYKKCGFEKLPSLKTKAISGEGPASIEISREFFLATSVADGGTDQAAAAAGAGGDAPMEEAKPVPLDEQTKAYRYGKQYVPIAEVENMFYQPGKTMQLLGFVDRAPLLKDQRYLFINDPHVLLPEKDDEPSQLAWSGLIQGMHQQGKAAVVRFARTQKSQISLCALLPQLGSATVPDHAIMVGLPFSEDIRTYAFPPMVPKEELKPSREQAAAARELVRSMDMAAGGQELVKPEDTSNPTLQRFYRSLGKLSLAPGQDVQGREEELVGPASEDALVQEVFETHWDQFGPGARDAAAAFKQAFQTQEVEAKFKKPGEEAAGEAAAGLFGEARAEALGADASSAVVLSDEYPVEDFKAAVSAGRLEAGVAALGRRAHDLVDKSVKNRAYAKALSCCIAIRQACVEQAHAPPFNDFLRGIKEKFEHSDAHSDFWQYVVENGVTLISSAEVASSSATPADAAAFLRPPQQEAAKAVAVEADVVDLGDLDDME